MRLYHMSASNDEKTSINPIDNEELEEEYESQSLPTVMRVNYKGPTDRWDSWESKAHTDGPSCYGCCTSHCAFSLALALTFTCTMCHAYVSGRICCCCSICYWPL